MSKSRKKPRLEVGTKTEKGIVVGHDRMGRPRYDRQEASFKNVKRKAVSRAANITTGTARAVTPEVYAQMFVAYCEKPSANAVAQTTGVTWATAQKAVTQGWPKSAMPPLKERYDAVMQETHAKAAYDITKANEQTLTMVRAYKSKLARKVAEVEIQDLPAAIGSELDRMARLEQFLMGGPDSRVEVGSTIYDGLTYDERVEYLRTGHLPSVTTPGLRENEEYENPTYEDEGADE